MTPRHRRTAAVVLGLAVIALHGGLVTQLAWLTRFGPGDDDALPPRLSVLFVQTLQPADAPRYDVAPPVELPSATPGPPREMALLDIPSVELAASAPQASDEPALDAAPETAPGTSPEVPPETTPQADASPAPTADPVPDPQPPADAASAPAFQWPPSTRLRYVLSGDYRGPIDGTAQVEWLREGSHYQVHLDVAIGLSFAPLISRQMSSDGELGPAGLVPKRYDERTRVLFDDPQPATLNFDGREVRLADGRRVPQPPGVQDSVSQFVQLTWRFLRQPSLLSPGTVLQVPLALPRRVGTWLYDVRGPVTLTTPVGQVETVHVQPRAGSARGGELVAEMWFAPRLQYLPVRILIRQRSGSYVDLLIDRLPEQALQPPEPPDAPAPPAPSAPPVPLQQTPETRTER